MSKIAFQNKNISITLSKLVKNNDNDKLKIMDNEGKIIQEKMEYEYPGYIVEVKELN